MTKKSFRGMMTTDTIDTIPLSTNNGSTGYRITKFQVISGNPVSENDRWVVKIYSIPQTVASVDVLVDFSDNTLLGVGVFTSNSASQSYPEDMTIIFDNMKFNQDIYITAKAESGTNINYYIELETSKLSLDENTVATLKDIRNIKSNE
jgi:hypothetical protein